MKLPEDYIAGFVDGGEGCFALKHQKEVKYKRRNQPVYYRWSAEFVISLRKDDADLLQLIKNTLGYGNITFTKKNARFQISDIEVLYKKIIPFFIKHPLYGKKQYDFKLWSEAVGIIYKNKKKRVNIKRGQYGFIKVSWNRNDLRRLNQIRSEMRKYKSKGLPFKWSPPYSII